MADRDDNPKSVCFSAVLRRLLCSGGSQTHPSDNIFEVEKSKFSRENPTKKETEESQLQARASPNLVARLMGLESLPEKNWVSKSPGSVTRSKSVNFMEYMLKNEDEEEEGTLHRRVKTSVSFRELPCTKRNQRNHEFFLMEFDQLDENREPELKFVKPEKGFKKLGQKKSEESKNKETDKKQSEVKRYNKKKVLKLKDEPRKDMKNRNHSMGSKNVSRFARNGVDYKKSPVIAAQMRRKRINPKEKEVESVTESSNPSPVSVLELDLEKYLIHDDYSSPGDSVTESTRLDSEIKSTEYMTKLIKIISELSEREIKETNWFSNSNRFEDLEELCKEIEQEAVDLVLDQLVDELVL